MSNLEQIKPKLQKLFPMLSSDSEGERLAVVAAIDRTLKRENLTFHDLAGAFSPKSLVRCEAERPGQDQPPAWFLMSACERIDWLMVAAKQAGPGSWLEGFAQSVGRRLAARLPLSPNQETTARRVIAEAWAKGGRP